MTGREFLPLAARLAAGGTEPEWRSAVSRAYYAAFHVARELFTDLGFTVPRAEQAHRYLTLRNAAPQVTAAEQIIRTLDGLTAATRTLITDAMRVYERDVLHEVTWH